MSAHGTRGSFLDDDPSSQAVSADEVSADGGGRRQQVAYAACFLRPFVVVVSRVPVDERGGAFGVDVFLDAKL